MTLSRHDVDLITALFRYRYLTSGQLARLMDRSGQNVRRAMRLRLVKDGYVTRMQASRNEEAAYCLGNVGFAFMAEELGCAVADLPFSRKIRTVRSFFWKHTVLVNDVRIAFDLATASPSTPIHIKRTIPEWELVPGAGGRRNRPHHLRFVLSERLEGADGTMHPHRPDCLFLVHPASADGPVVALFTECDRGTETMRRIRGKLQAYWLYFRRRRFVDAFGAMSMRVLFVLDGGERDDRRIRSMQAELGKFVASRSAFQLRDRGQTYDIVPEDFSHVFRFARARDLSPETALRAAIWHGPDADAPQRPLFLPPVAREESDADTHRAAATALEASA